MPFQIAGAIAVIVSILLLVTIPKVNVVSQDKQTGKDFGTVELMRVPSVALPLVDTFACNFGFGMTESMIGLYMDSIGADTNEISTAFIVFGGC